MMKPGIGVQSNWNMMKEIKNINSAAKEKTNPAVMARYLPMQASATHPVNGTKSPEHVVCNIKTCMELTEEGKIEAI